MWYICGVKGRKSYYPNQEPTWVSMSLSGIYESKESFLNSAFGNGCQIPTVKTRGLPCNDISEFAEEPIEIKILPNECKKRVIKIIEF